MQIVSGFASEISEKKLKGEERNEDVFDVVHIVPSSYVSWQGLLSSSLYNLGRFGEGNRVRAHQDPGDNEISN